MDTMSSATEMTFIADKLPTEFESLLGAMIISGWSYEIRNQPEDGHIVLDVTGWASDVARAKMPRTQAVRAVLEYVGGEWIFDGLRTGLRRDKPSPAGLYIDLMSAEKLIDYVGRRIDPAMLIEIAVEAKPEPVKGKGKRKAASEKVTTSEPVQTETVVEEEVIDETAAVTA